MTETFLIIAIVSIVVTGVVSFFGSSAGSKFNFSDARRVQAGMSTAEVQAIIGPPYMVTSSSDNKELWVWSYVSGMTGARRSLSLIFKEGLLESEPKIPDSFR